MGKAHFGIAIDNPFVYAGSMLTGKVWADIRNEIRGSALTVELKGKEKTTVRYTETKTTGSGDNKTTERVTRYAYGTRRIIEVLLPVNNLDMIRSGRVAPGRYAIPFQVELPSFLPSSSYFSEHGGSFSIEYKIKAILKGSGVLYNYNCEQPVQVLAAPTSTQLIPYLGEPSTTQVNLCCCFNRGSMTLGARMENTVIEKGMAATVCFSCRNQSSVDIQDIQAKLVQKCKWYASGRSEHTTKVINQTGFNKDRGMDAKSKEEQNRTRALDSVRNERMTMLEELRVGVNRQVLQVPPQAITSYSGELIRVEHALHIWVNTPSCIDNPEICIPIMVSEPRPPETFPPNGLGIPITQPVSPMPAPVPSAPLAQPQQTGNIPIAVAHPLPSQFANDPTVVYAQPICVAGAEAVTGGAAMIGQPSQKEDDIVVEPLAPAGPPGMAALLNELKTSVREVEVIRTHVAEPAWQPFFASLSPPDFGSIIQQVRSSFDETEAAILMARNIHTFTCQHVATAVKMASVLNRSTMVEELVEYCVDLPTNQNVIKAGLTEWEKTVTERAFEEALKQTGMG